MKAFVVECQTPLFGTIYTGPGSCLQQLITINLASLTGIPSCVPAILWPALKYGNITEVGIRATVADQSISQAQGEKDLKGIQDFIVDKESSVGGTKWNCPCTCHHGYNANMYFLKTSKKNDFIQESDPSVSIASF